MKYYNICTRQAFTDKAGNDKVKWLNCGTLKVMDNGKQFIQMNHLPDVSFFVFEPKSDNKTQQDDIKWD